MSIDIANRVIRAPRGTKLNCRGWYQEAALRMLCNNLDPEVAEDPKNLVVYGGRGKAARNWECFETNRRDAHVSRERRDAARPVGQTGRGFQDAPGGASRAHRELASRPEVGDVGALLGAREQGPDDVRPDDGGQLDVHRDAGDPTGNVRDVRRVRGEALRRLAPRGDWCSPAVSAEWVGPSLSPSR